MLKVRKDEYGNIKKCIKCAHPLKARGSKSICRTCYEKKGTKVTRRTAYRKERKEKGLILEIDIEDLYLEFPRRR